MDGMVYWDASLPSQPSQPVSPCLPRITDVGESRHTLALDEASQARLSGQERSSNIIQKVPVDDEIPFLKEGKASKTHDEW